MYTNVIETDIAGAASRSDLVIYITDSGREGMFEYRAGTPPYGANNATLLNASNGYYERVFDSAVNVKWFGAGNNVTSNFAIRDAIYFIVTQAIPANSTNYNLYFPKGIYLLDDSTGSDAISIDLSIIASKRLVIYGDGPEESIIKYVGNNPNCNLLYFKATFVGNSEIRDLSFINNISAKSATGIKLDQFAASSMSRVNISGFNIGMVFTDVLACQFNFLKITENNTGIDYQFVEVPPNLIAFNSCFFVLNSTYAIYWVVPHGLHSVVFNSCGFEHNGSMYVPEKGSPLVPKPNTGAIYCNYDFSNGANGLNLNYCYFEGNSGTADVHLLSRWYTNGTLTFTGNTFNRNTQDEYCINNILIEGLKVALAPVPLGNNKSKISFIGNGFFTPLPPTGTYIPDANRRTIQLNVYNGQYWDFDVVELGNNYTSQVDKPSFYEDPSQIIIPQISEYNRMLASARASDNGSAVSTLLSYNITSIIKVPGYTGTYQVNFANSLPRVPVVQITPIGAALVAYVTLETTTYIEIQMVNLQGVFTDGSFDLLVF